MKGTDSIPSMHNNGQSVIIRHKEFLGEITAASAFTVQETLEINPGNLRTFPWLSSIATKFQEYSIKGMVFHYIPSSGTYTTTNPAVGTVMMQTSYRASDTPPASKVEMLNEYWSTESIPSEAFCHPIECDPQENPFKIQYIRAGAPPSGDSRLMYDLGVVSVAVSGCPASNYVLGDLWVSYEIELKKPVVFSNSGNSTAAWAAKFTATGSTSGSILFDGAMTDVGTMDVTTDGVRTLRIPKGHVGRFLVGVYVLNATTFTAVNTAFVPTLTNCTLSEVAPVSTYELTTVAGAGTATSAYYGFAVNISDPSKAASLLIPSTTLTGGTIASVTATITPYGFL
jgi:hypothetical protein